MIKIYLILVLLVVVLMAACTNRADFEHEVAANPIEIPVAVAGLNAPGGLELNSNLPGMMRLIGYSGDNFLTGAVQSFESLAPRISRTGNDVSLVQNSKARVNPDDTDYINLWKLKVSDQQPFDLLVKNLQAEGHWNLSGLPVTSLKVDAGKGKNAFTTDEPNPGVMEFMNVQCGTGEVVFEGILNSKCENMQIESGSGQLTLRFNGQFSGHRMDVNIRGGNGPVSLTVPGNIPTLIHVENDGRMTTGNGITCMASNSGLFFQNRTYQPDLIPDIEIEISGIHDQIILNTLD